MQTTTLQSVVLSERTAALAAFEASSREALAETCRELDRAKGAAAMECDRVIVAAQTAVQAKRDECAADIASKIEQAIYPAAARFESDPRGATKAIAAAWSILDGRATRELGYNLAPFQLMLSFAAAAGRLADFGGEDCYHYAIPSSPAGVAAYAAKALAEGNVVEAEHRLRELERAVANFRCTYPDHERACHMKGCAVGEDASKMLAELREKRRAAEPTEDAAAEAWSKEQQRLGYAYKREKRRAAQPDPRFGEM